MDKLVGRKKSNTHTPFWEVPPKILVFDAPGNFLRNLPFINHNRVEHILTVILRPFVVPQQIICSFSEIYEENRVLAGNSMLGSCEDFTFRSKLLEFGYFC